MFKPFNKVVIYGKVGDYTERTSRNRKTPYLDIIIRCESELYGDLKTRFRLYGNEAIGDIKQTFIQNRDALLRFTGYMDQYEKDDKLFSGATGFDVKVMDDSNAQRSAFILNGLFNGSSSNQDHDTIIINILVNRIKKVAGKDDETEETEFKVEIRNADKDLIGFSYKDIIRGDGLKVRGHLMDIDKDFGSSGDLAPIVEKYEVVKTDKPPL